MKPTRFVPQMYVGCNREDSAHDAAEKARTRQLTMTPRKTPKKRRPIKEDMGTVLPGARPVRVLWDMDVETTNAMMEDVGVARLPGVAEEMAHEAMLAEVDDLVLEEINMDSQNIDVSVPHSNSVKQTSQFLPLQTEEDHKLTQSLGRIFSSQTCSPQRVITRRHRVEPVSPFNRLANELILDIFKWLPKLVLIRCARVCKRWKHLAYDETLWKRLDLANKVLKAGVLGRVLNRGVAILRLTKSEVRTPIFSQITIPASPIMSRVQYLDLSMAIITTQGLEEILASCRYLRKLSLENCTINDNICRYIGQNIHLETLNLCMCTGITENGLVPICNNLTRLEALNIAWTSMSRGAVVYLVICLPPSLTKLNLSGCRETLHDEDVQQLCGSCSGLKELDLSDCTQLTAMSVEYIVRALRGLEYIALSRCYNVAPASLLQLGRILTLLAVDVFGMLKESALMHLRDTMTNIEINKFPFSSIARPTTGIRRTSIWGLRVRDVFL